MEKYIDYYNNDRIKQKIGRHEPGKIPNSSQPISCIMKTLTLRGHYRNWAFFRYNKIIYFETYLYFSRNPLLKIPSL
ncbi:hypothetical protein [Lysinibacillus pakistanensis]|uniref:hypothetical protein n=1 Tax=Lysinibacillus pakistanensis TaxID=759811 RepID=UPI003D289EE2